jgi:hypothetical protein
LPNVVGGGVEVFNPKPGRAFAKPGKKYLRLNLQWM